MLVDSHCHLNFPDFLSDFEDVLARAHDAGVTRFLTVNTRLNELPDLVALTTRYSEIYCTAGVHPHDAADYADGDLVQRLEEALHFPKVVGLGETGLDYHYNHSPKAAQIKAFEAHIQVAVQQDYPLVIHTREADQDTLSCLEGKNARGVFHCFSGDQTLARKALDLGFFISFSGIITFNKAEALRDVVRYVPLDQLLVETDSPYLAPVPHRGKRNEPGFVRLVATQVAALKNVDLATVARVTTENFETVFNRVLGASCILPS